jgi:hypothetical protein
MSPAGTSSISFPAFRGVTRQLILVNVFSYFALLLTSVIAPGAVEWAMDTLGFAPSLFLHGYLWQPLTYSFIYPPGSILSTALSLVSLWFLAGFLEQLHPKSWVLGLYAASILGTAFAALGIYAASGPLGYSVPDVALLGCFGAIFGMLVAIGILYGETEFLLFLTIPIKARYIAVISGLIAIAMLFFSSMRVYAFAQLGGAFFGWIFIRLTPRRGLTYAFSERWFGLRNSYYRWKRHKAARKFEVYMRSQGRTVRFDGRGKPLDDKDHDDKKRWN